MDTQNLQAFIRVSETGSFSAAAEELFLTQPAVSKRVSTLEEQLGCKLFDRINRSVSLTEAGRQLLPRAKKIIQDLEETQRVIQDLNGEITGRLKLATSHHIGLHRLPPILKAFTAKFPAVKLDLYFLDSEKAYDDVLHGNLELAVITLAPSSDPLIHTTEIWADPLIFVVAKEHPLAKAKKIDLATLSKYPAILPGPMTYTGQIIQHLFNQHKLTLDVGMSTNYLETLKMMTDIGLGWSVLPKTMVSDLKTLSIPNLALSRTLGCIYHRNRSLSNAAKAFIALLNQ